MMKSARTRFSTTFFVGVLAFIAGSTAGSAQLGTAQIIGNCRSLSLRPAPERSGLDVEYFTTSDGKSGIPANLFQSTTGLMFSDEFLPIVGSPGVYEADYVTFEGTRAADYGVTTVSLPAVDSDANGLPDITQKSMPVDGAVSGQVHSDFFVASQALTGRIHRNAGQTEGTYSVAVGLSSFTGVFAIPNVEGTVKYSRSAQTFTLDITFTAPHGGLLPMNGSTSFNVVDQNTIQLASFVIRGGSVAVTASATTLKRSGTVYRGNMEFLDGDPSTPWSDYVSWVVEITDNNDLDRNGIPDLSDALPVPPKLITQPASQTVVTGSDITFSVTATGTSPLKYQWQFNGQNISGADQSSFGLTNVQLAQSGEYVVIVSNVGGTTKSAIARLSITGPALPTSCVATPASVANWWPGERSALDVGTSKAAVATGNVNYGSGKVGDAFVFGSDEGLVQGEAAYSGIDGWTMGCWAYWRGAGTAASAEAQCLIYHGDGDRNGYGLYIVGSGWCQEYPPLCPHVGELTVLFGGITWFFPSVKLEQNTWIHLMLSRAGGVAKLYLNGQLVWTQQTPNPNPPSSHFFISSWKPASFHGSLDEVCLFSSALSDKQVQEVFWSDSFGMCRSLTALTLSRTKTGQLLLQGTAPAGVNQVLMVSPDLRTWSALTRLSNATGSFKYADPTAPRPQRRFYRLAPAN